MPPQIHGHATRGKNSSTYRAWASMKARCYRPSERAFKDYGARGIKVCKRWLKFGNFLADMGVRPNGLTLERKDNESGYSKENCCWATYREQALNKRNTRRMLWHGKLTPLIIVAEQHGIAKGTLRDRIRRGWTPERAATTKHISHKAIGAEGIQFDHWKIESCKLVTRACLSRCEMRKAALVSTTFKCALGNH